MDNISDRLVVEEHNGKQIVYVDYKGLKEKGMIDLIKLHLDLTVMKKIPFIADCHNTYVTSAYMIEGQKFVELTKHLFDKGAFLGLGKIKLQLLKAIVFQTGVNYKAFDAKEEAIAYLTDTAG